jgi:outer membrane biosynthesis protein TonB
LDQKLLSDVVATAFSRVDGLTLRRFVNGKNVAVQVATTYTAETSVVRAHAAMLLTRAGAMRADLARGGDVIAMIVLRAYGVQSAEVDDGNQRRGFILGDLVLLRPGSGEVMREALAAKAVDHYFSDGTRERRSVGRRKAEPAPERAEAPEPEPEVEPEPEPEPEPEARPTPRRDERRARERRSDRRAKPAPSSRRTSKSKRKVKDSDDEDEAEEGERRTRKRSRTRRRRRRQPLILE